MHIEPLGKVRTLLLAPSAENAEDGIESMRVVLQVRSGPEAGKKVWLRPTQVIEVGRTERSEFVVPHDAQLSSRHFALECDYQMCRVRDLDSSNGTLLNGKKVTEAIVQDGDQIVAGLTTFVVRIEGVLPPAENSSPLSEEDRILGSAPDNSQSSQVTQPVSAPFAAGLPSKGGPIKPSAVAEALAIPSPYNEGVDDDDPAVRREVLLAAVWTRQKWLLDYCRKISQSPALEHWDAITLLAILGRPSDLERILALGKSVQLGPKRYEVLGKFGHPAVVETLLKRIDSQDPVNAPAAGLAFTKITGLDIESDRMATIPAEKGTDPEQVEPEPIEVRLPSPALATDQWKKVKDHYSKGTRWCRGFDLSSGVNGEVLPLLDLESRWEACLRGNFEGTWKGSLMDLEAFPQRRC